MQRHDMIDTMRGLGLKGMAAAFDEGLSCLTFGRVAKRIGVSDRIVVYYFPTKEDLVGGVLAAVGAELGLSREQIGRALAGCTPPKMRLQLWEANGVRVLDVVVEHPLYGELRGQLMRSEEHTSELQSH